MGLLELCVEGVPSKLLTNLVTQRRTGKFCDIKLHVGGSWLWAHSSVISVFSDALHNCFVSGQKGKNYNSSSLNEPLEVVISELAESDSEELECVECANKVIDFLYNGHISFDSLEHVHHITAFGRVLQVQELHDLCVEARSKLRQESHHEEGDASQRSEAKVAKGHPYTCLGCGSKQRTAAALLQHLQQPDHENTNLNCSICLRYRAKDSGDLAAHLSLHRHHLPFFCLECDARFRTRTALTAHLPKHSTATPFLCAECGRGFKWKQALISHALVHSAEKRHLCDTCGYTTAHHSSFRAHKLVHAGVSWSCPQPGCHFVATRKQSLAHHIPTHTNQRHYQCEICGQSFSMHKNLRRHMAKHEASPIGLMCCPVPGCQYSNTRADKIKAHAERHRSGKPVKTALIPRVRQKSPRVPKPIVEKAPGNQNRNNDSENDLDQNIVIVIPMEMASIVEEMNGGTNRDAKSDNS